MKEARCIHCNRKLAEFEIPGVNMSIASTAEVQQGMTIKCPRCGVISAIRYDLLTSKIRYGNTRVVTK